MYRILCIDDDPDICHLLKRFLSKNNYDVEVAYLASSGLELLQKSKFDLVLCDFRLPDLDGMELIKAIKQKHPYIPLIIITGYSDVKMAVSAMKHGVYEYVTKPIHPEEILITISQAISAEVQNTVKTTGIAVKSPTKANGFVLGDGPGASRFQKLLSLVAPTDMTVVITGESGTGKEVAANAIHQQSLRADKPFVAVDCGALPTELAGSELFGHKKGSFTGALTDKKGQFEFAQGGTLFLDEIGNLSYENQIKLLRVLQERKIRPIGENKDIAIDVRIIAATNENLKKAVLKGEFREDLYYRISEFVIELPALRERQGDIMRYAHHFLDLSRKELNKNVDDFDPAVSQIFESYRWPGNLREMKNVIKRAVLFAENSHIKTAHLPEELYSPSHFSSQETQEEDGDLDLKKAAETAERRVILKALALTGNRKTKTAELLKVDRKTLYNKMQQLGIEG